MKIEFIKFTTRASVLAVAMASMPAFAIIDGFPIDPGTGLPIDPGTGLPVDPNTVPVDDGGVIPGTGDLPDLTGVPEIDPNTVPIGPGAPGVDDLNDFAPTPEPNPTIVLPDLTATPVVCADEGITPNLKRGAAFFQINNILGSELVTLNRNPRNGSLCEVSRQPTGGFGDITGIVTSAQNNVVNLGSRCVFVANPGFDPADVLTNTNGTISSFRINRTDTVLRDVDDSGGPNPRALALFDKVLYVVNGGVGFGLFGPNVSIIPESIQGYDINRNRCTLRPIPGSFNLTVDPEGDPGDINFAASGDHLMVAQRRTTFAFGSGLEPANVEVFPIIHADYTTMNPVVNDVQEQGVFGFRTWQRPNGEDRSAHTHGNFQLIGAGGTSTWRINADSTMTGLTTSNTGDDSPNVVENGGSDTCWNVLSHNNRWTYTSAFFDSAYQRHFIATNGSLGPAQPAGGPGGISSSNAAGPNANIYAANQGGLDMARTDARWGRQFVYVMNNPVPPSTPVLPVVSILPGRLSDDSLGGAVLPLQQFRTSGYPNNSHGLAVY